MAEEKKYVWTPLSSHPFVVGIHIASLFLPWWTLCPAAAGKPWGFSFCGASPMWLGWLWLGVWKAALIASKNGTDLFTCEAAVSVCPGQMLIPEAKHSSSRTDPLLYLKNPTYHFPTLILQDTEKHRVSWHRSSRSRFFSLKGSKPGWWRKPSQPLGIKFHQGLTQKTHRAEMEGEHHGIPLNTSHVSLSNKFFSAENWV